MSTFLNVGDNNTIALSSDGETTLRYNSTTQRLVFSVHGVDVASLDANGNWRIHGTAAGRQATV